MMLLFQIFLSVDILLLLSLSSLSNETNYFESEKNFSLVSPCDANDITDASSRNR